MAKIKTKRANDIIKTQVQLGFNEELSVNDLIFPCEQDSYGLLKPVKVLRKAIQYEDIHGITLSYYLVSGLTFAEFTAVLEQSLLVFANLERKKKSISDICTDNEYVFYDMKQGRIRYLFGTFYVNGIYSDSPIEVLKRITERYSTDETRSLDLRRNLLNYLERDNATLPAFERLLMDMNPDLIRSIRNDYTSEIFDMSTDGMAMRAENIAYLQSAFGGKSLYELQNSGRTDYSLESSIVHREHVSQKSHYPKKTTMNDEYVDLHDGMTIMEDRTVRMEELKAVENSVECIEKGTNGIAEQTTETQRQVIGATEIKDSLISDDSELIEPTLFEAPDVTVRQNLEGSYETVRNVWGDSDATERQLSEESEITQTQSPEKADLSINVAERGEDISKEYLEEKIDKTIRCFTSISEKNEKQIQESYENSNAEDTTVLMRYAENLFDDSGINRNIRYPFIEKVQTGEIVSVDKPWFLIGRDVSSVDYAIHNRYVGRSHMGIVSKNGRSFIVDMNSKNGTYLNGKQVPPNEEVPIKEGEIFSIGGEDYRFHESEERL